MRPRRFTARGHPQQGQRRRAWGGYQHAWRWWRRRARYFASGNANTTCPGCQVRVGERDDVHHLAYPNVPGTESDEELIVMCRTCHESVHASLDAWPALRRMPRAAATWLVIDQLRQRQPTGDMPASSSTPPAASSTPATRWLSRTPHISQAQPDQTGDTP